MVLLQHVSHNFYQKFVKVSSILIRNIYLAVAILTFIMNGDIITFISNNFKGIQASQKRIKLLEYLKIYVRSNGFVFLQECLVSDEKQWQDEFNGTFFLSHVKANSPGVLISYYGIM